MKPWTDAVADRPWVSLGLAIAMIGLAAGAGLVLRRVTRRTRSLHALVLAIVGSALLIGAVGAFVLGWLMVLEGDEAQMAVVVLAVTAVLAVVLAVVAVEPLARDARRIEHAVRQLEDGRRDVRTDVDRADELGHVARALDELTVRLDQLERERDTFETERRAMLSSVGHDLRSPLSALRAAIEALADGVAPDPQRYLRSMTADVEALSALIDDLFLLSSLDAGRYELTREPVDLAEIADEAVEALAPSAERRGVAVRLLADGSAAVTGNAIAIGRVIRNLVDNAIRHAPPGSTVTIAVDAGASGVAPTVRVTDDGPGFPDEFAAHAFERFARADASRSRATGGAGLGLAIARGLVEAHGGSIWIERSPSSGGAEVAFEIPAAVAS